jgi:hypothetical protein
MNWGYKLMVAFIVFAVMILYLVVRCFNTTFELVDKDYYKSELKYQEVIDGSGRANTLSSSPVFTQNGKSITLQMPDEMKDQQVTGTIYFYCAYDSNKDKKFHLEVDKNGKQVFGGSITPGSYIVKLDWSQSGKTYYTEKQITIL